MKLITYTTGSAPQLGVLTDDQITPLGNSGIAADMLSLVQAGPAALEQVRAYVQSGTLPTLPLSSVRLLAPLANPPKLVAIGLNYLDHCREQNVPVPTKPLVFTKFPSSIIATGQDIVWQAEMSQQVDYEAELAVVIGKRARFVSPEQALDCVFGYTIINDISARDIQFGDGQWVRGKSLDTFCPMGPHIVTADEITDPQTLAIRCKVNEQYLQDSNTKEMVFGVRQLIVELSKSFTLEPGDIISTGTPHGVGVFRKPPVYLQNGDQVTVEIEKIGSLLNHCVVTSV